jgi:coenzyme Q-binding protein COQ10
MPKHNERRILPYTADQMFGLVADIRRYPEFLPWCTALRVRSDEERGGVRHLLADMAVAFKGIEQRFSSKVELRPKERKIVVDYVEGPFRYLHNIWHFEQMGSACRVHFDIDFEFRSRLLSALIRSVFTRAVTHMADAFEARAHALYGSKAKQLP